MKKFSKMLLSAVLALSVVGTATACEMPEQLQGIVDQVGGMIGITPEKPDNEEDKGENEGGDNTQGGGDNTQGGGDNTQGGGDNTQGGGDNTQGGGTTEVTKYTVTYETNGGSAVPSAEYAIGDAFALPTTTKEGYTFNYWKLNGVEVEVGATWEWETDITLTAEWTAKVYTIVFSYGEVETAVPANYTVTYNAAYDVTSLPNIMPTTQGYRFVGWKVENSEILFDTQEEMTGTWSFADKYDGTDDNTITFVAQWLKVYTIKYVTSGGAEVDLSGLDTEFVEGETLTFVTVSDKYNDYTFTGWTINGVKYTEITDQLIADLALEGDTITVVANWKEKGNWTKNY